MAQKVYVYNLNKYPLREQFKGEEVTIEAEDFWKDKKGIRKAVDIYEANDFRGQYHPVPVDGSGKMVNDPKHYKMIKMVPVEDPDDVVIKDEIPAFKCMAKECKHVSPSQEELEAHTKVRHPSIETLILPEEDAQLSRKAKKG